MSEKGLVYVISGPSGSGKGTVVEVLRKLCPGLGVSISATTRAPRENEAEGVHYYFKSREEFESLIADGEVIEHTIYNNNYYGTLRAEVKRIIEGGRDVLLEIEVDGGGQIKRLMGDECVLIMLVAPSAAEQERRLRARGTESEEVIAARVERAKAEVREAVNYDYIVVNETDGQEECARRIMAIMDSAHLTESRMIGFLDEYFR